MWKAYLNVDDLTNPEFLISKVLYLDSRSGICPTSKLVADSVKDAIRSTFGDTTTIDVECSYKTTTYQVSIVPIESLLLKH